MGRRFITARDIDDVLAAGGSELTIGPDDRLTDLARDHARERGVAIVSGTAAAGSVAERPPAAAQQAAAGPAGSGPAGSGPAGSAASPSATSAGAPAEGPTRRELRAAVRAAVVDEFGMTPPGVDAAIGRVLDRFGVED